MTQINGIVLLTGLSATGPEAKRIDATVQMAGVDSNGVPRLVVLGAGGVLGATTLAGLSDVDITSPADQHFLQYDAASGKWIDSAGLPGSGTVTSVGMSVPGVIFSIAGSPVTTSGTLALSLLTQTANTHLAGPTSGGAATPTFRTLVAADIPGTLGATTFSGAITGQAGINLSSGQVFSINLDTGLSRLAAGSLALGNANQGDFTATLKLTTLNAVSALQLNGTSINTAGTLSNVAYLSGATFTGTVDMASQALAFTDATLIRDAANILALRNGVNPQQFNVYNQFTTTSNYVNRISILGLDGGSGNPTIQLEKAGASGANADFNIGNQTTGAINFRTSATYRWNISSSGHILAATTNTYDIGTSATVAAPRTVYAGTSVVTPTVNATTAIQLNGSSINTAGTLSNVAYLNQANTFTAGITVNGGTNVIQNLLTLQNSTPLRLSGASINIDIVTSGTEFRLKDQSNGPTRLRFDLSATIPTIIIGGTDTATPLSGLLTIGESSRAGTDNNVAGASGTIQPGAGTGTGATTPLILKAPIQVASGSGAQTQTEGMRVQAVGTSIGLGFYGHAAAARASAYTPTNVTTDRSYDANVTSIDELADVLGTLIADLQGYGLLQ